MTGYKLLIEVRKNGEFYMKSDVATLADLFDMYNTSIQRKAAVGGVICIGEDKYMLRYTGERAPKRNPHVKPAEKPKPKLSLSEVERLGRDMGLKYGYMTAKLEGRI